MGSRQGVGRPRRKARGAEGAGGVMRATTLSILGLLATLAIGWFVLDTALWLLGGKEPKRLRMTTIGGNGQRIGAGRFGGE